MTENRTLRSKSDRGALFYAQNGKCAICGKDLGDDWQADHVVPYAVSGTTNVHGMQAVCAKCNQRKGKNMLRGHQLEMQQIARMIATGNSVKTIIASVTPGGGKSSLPIILAKELIPSFADAICWVVPRTNLQVQGEKAFKAEWLRGLLHHSHEIRKSTNDVNPSRNLAGHITTYQAIGTSWSNLAQDFARKRYILFLDEPHHIADNGSWANALQPLIDNAKLVVFASGTFERHDKKPIAFLPYLRLDEGLIVDLSPSPAKHVLAYNRTAALREKAIVPLSFEIFDGRTEYIDANGDLQVVESIEKTDNSTDALITALNTDFAYNMLQQCVSEWQDYRTHVLSSAKLLVVAPNIYLAKEYNKWLENNTHHEALIATSEDSAAAALSIARFRNDKESMQGRTEVNMLVTVGMAYEGLDCPDITHVACLTRIRSKPWLEQCFARANRTKSGKTEGFIYGPADPLFVQVVDQIRQEQMIVAKEIEESMLRGASEKRDTPEAGDVIPLVGSTTKRRSENLTGDELTYSQTEAIYEAMREEGIYGSAVSFLRAAQKIGYVVPHMDDEPAEPNFVSSLTPSQREDRMRRRIEKHVRSAAHQVGTTPNQINYELMASFNKRRADMSESELSQVWAYLQARYPVNYETNNQTG